MSQPSSHLSIRLGAEAPDYLGQPIVSICPAGYAAPAQFLDLSNLEDLAKLSQLAAQILANPIATQQLCDRVVELLQQDLRSQQEWHQAGRRW